MTDEEGTFEIQVKRTWLGWFGNYVDRRHGRIGLSSTKNWWRLTRRGIERKMRRVRERALKGDGWLTID